MEKIRDKEASWEEVAVVQVCSHGNLLREVAMGMEVKRPIQSLHSLTGPGTITEGGYAQVIGKSEALSLWSKMPISSQRGA